MTLFEAGMIAGAPAGAIAGGLLAKSGSPLGAVGGALTGMAAGAAVGWLYGWAIVVLCALADLIWRAADERSTSPPAEEDVRAVTGTAVPGVFAGVFVGAIFAVATGWVQAALAMLGTGAAGALIAVARRRWASPTRGNHTR